MNGILRIFAYGTLKQGFPGHDSLCRGVLKIEPAHLKGRLFKLSPVIPVMIIPDTDILARGSGDPLHDIAVQEYFQGSGRRARDPLPAEIPEDRWGRVTGELLSFEDPEMRLPLLDSYEEFRPGKESPYIRVLARVNLSNGMQTTAWMYTAGFDARKLTRFHGDTWFPDISGT